jgi:endonuclease-3
MAISRPPSTPTSQRATPKRPLDIDLVLRRIAEAVRPYPPAALFQLADEGFQSPFEQLVACIISIRTLDEVTVEVGRRVFARARTPAELLKLEVSDLDSLLRPSTFHENKAPQLLKIAERVQTEFGGELPCDRELILEFAGVGPKCANLTLGIACDQEWISVDTHVHRITNRWGYVHANAPEATMVQLEQKLPRHHWLTINRLLVPFGKHICTFRAPKCSTCPVLEMCQQVGVATHG